MRISRTMKMREMDRLTARAARPAPRPAARPAPRPAARPALRRFAAARALRYGLVLALASACVDSPGATSPASETSDPLADAFDALSRAAGEYNDLARSDGFAFAALSVRSGITPSRLEVQTGTTVDEYDAFVSGAQWEQSVPMPFRPPARRSLVGWHRTTGGATKVILLSVPSDSAPILSPISLGMGASTVAVYDGASAMQNEGYDTPQGKPDIAAAWYGTSGWVKLKEVAVVGECPDSARHHKSLGLSHCEEARYQVAFDLSMQRLTGRPPQLASGTSIRKVSSVGEALVNGLRLRFSCASPSSASGCR